MRSFSSSAALSAPPVAKPAGAVGRPASRGAGAAAGAGAITGAEAANEIELLGLDIPQILDA